MAFVPGRHAHATGFFLTPMIDVTFQLLIFFVCANAWSHLESAEQLDLPAPIRSAQEAGSEERPRITINLRANGELVLSGKKTSRDRLTQVLRSAAHQHGERLEVVLRAHQQVPFAQTQEVFQACAAAGIRQVRFAVLRESR